jgi:leucyl-tRNA synthetase
VTTEVYADFLKVLSPFAPHITEELWHEVLGNTTSILTEKFPVADPSKLEFDDVTIAVQINGKLRGEFTISKDATKEDLEINAREIMTSRLVGKTIARVIVVPKKLVNFVVAE